MNFQYFLVNNKIVFASFVYKLSITWFQMFVVLAHTKPELLLVPHVSQSILSHKRLLNIGYYHQDLHQWLFHPALCLTDCVIVSLYFVFRSNFIFRSTWHYTTVVNSIVFLQVLFVRMLQSHL